MAVLNHLKLNELRPVSEPGWSGIIRIRDRGGYRVIPKAGGLGGKKREDVVEEENVNIQEPFMKILGILP